MLCRHVSVNTVTILKTLVHFIVSIPLRCYLSGAFRYFSYVTTHSPTLPSLYLRHRSFSNSSVASPTSHFILQPFFRFSYVTSSSRRPLIHLTSLPCHLPCSPKLFNSSGKEVTSPSKGLIVVLQGSVALPTFKRT